jgi:hypothetical protein
MWNICMQIFGEAPHLQGTLLAPHLVEYFISWPVHKTSFDSLLVFILFGSSIIPDTADMDSSMEPNGTDTHMRTGSSGDPMAPWSALLFAWSTQPYTGIMHAPRRHGYIWRDLVADLHLFRSRALLIVGEHLRSCTNQRYLCSMFQVRQDGQVWPWVFTS